MKLSEAIREGAKLAPQYHGWYVGIEAKEFGTCALGAAYHALFEPIAEAGDLTPHEGWRAILQDAYPEINYRIFDQITDRNDDGESRESIADWLESIGL